MRGINTGGVASTVGVYVDDVPFGSSSGLANGSILSGDFDTFDVERIEVLRGPQGTLYGASSLGGVLKYVQNRASTGAPEGRLLGSVEDTENGDLGYSLTGLVNVPINDNFAFRLTGFYRSDDGYIDSTGANPIPSLTDPLNNIVDGSRVDSGLNATDTFGGRLGALIQPSDRVAVYLKAQVQNINSDGSSLIEADPITLEPLPGRPVQSRYHPEVTDIEYEVYSASVDWEFGAASFESISSYSSFVQDFQVDLALATDLTGGPPLSSLVTFLFGDPATRPLSTILPQVTDTEKITQEFRLTSSDGDAFEWLIGLYYTDEDSGIQQNILAVDAGTENPASGIPALAFASLVSTYEELALFANATWHVSPHFELSFGARASDNEQVASQLSDGPLAGGLTRFDDATSSETPFTYSISPRFELKDNSSLYARIATGFRPGGPNVLPPGAPADTPATYDSDELTSYEVGYRKSGASGKYSLDLSAFLLDWEDIQLFLVVNGFGINGNGGTAESKGFEFTTSVRPATGWTMSLNGAYTDASLTRATDPIVGGLNGDPLPYVPEWGLGFNTQFEWTAFGDATAYVGGGLGYVGERTASFDNRDPSGNLRELDSHTTLSVRTGLYIGRHHLELYGKNLTDETGFTSIDTGGSLPNGAFAMGLIRPRTVGVSVGTRF